MSVQPDTRSAKRKLLDEQMAAEAPLPPPNLPADAKPMPLEQLRPVTAQRPLAVIGIVENGLIRPLDPQVKFPEKSRVIIVAANAS